MRKISPNGLAGDHSEAIDASRRTLFAAAAVSPLILLGLAAAPAAAQANPCVDLAKLNAGQRSMRASLGFKVQTTDPVKRCGTCAFFTATTGECGKCQLFENGPVGASSFCNSWAKKG